MKILISNHTDWKAQKLSNYEIGNLFSSPRHRTVSENISYYALDNGAFSCFKNNQLFCNHTFLNFLDKWVVKNKTKPQWIVVPDVVGDKEKTITSFFHWENKLKVYGFPLAFAVQDGMTKKDIPNNISIIFIGGSTEWKVKTIPYWTAHFPRVHVARVNGWTRLLNSYLAGAESVDGTGFFRFGWDGQPCINLRLFLKWQNGEFDYTWQHLYSLNPSQRRKLLNDIEGVKPDFSILPLFNEYELFSSC